MDNSSKWLRQTEDLSPSSQSGTSTKKIICTKKSREIDHTKICLWISSIQFIINLNKADKYFYVVGEKQFDRV